MRVVRFIQIGDLHLDQGQRNVDRLAAFDFVINAGMKTEHLGAWLFPGDVNSARMSIENRNALILRVLRMADIAPVVIVPGNHDLPGDLDFLRNLRTTWPIEVITSPQVITLELADHGSRSGQIASIACLPYPSKAMLVAAGTPHEQLGVAAANALDILFMDLGSRLEQARTRGEIALFLGHVNVAGAIASTGQPQIGQELEITGAHLVRLGPCFKGLNHIHKHQIVNSGIESAFFAGSLSRQDWGEIEPKGYLEIAYGAHGWGGYAGDGPFDSAGEHWDYDVAFRLVPVAPMYHVEGTLTRDEFTWRVTKGPGGPKDDAPESWAGCDVRVRASYVSSERDVLTLAKERVQRIFAVARRFEFEPIAVPDRVLRAPEIVAAKTFDEKLRAWAKLSGVTWSAEIERCAILLQGENDEAIIADVQTRIS